jgi:hypothetical protein
MSFYCGARLVGTPDLYNPTRMIEVQTQAAGWSSRSRLYCRPPYYAMLVWPLSRLPYLQAYYVWQALSVAAVLLFVVLWPIGDAGLKAAACCWSFPLFSALAQGQDVTFVLALIAVVASLARKGRMFAGGLALAMCAAKFHIFLLVPFWIVAQKLWRFGLGFVAGAALLIAFSFLGGGSNWPADYLTLLLDPNTNPAAAVMPNFHGNFAGLQNGGILELSATAAVAIVALWCFARMQFEYGLVMTVASGILIAHHGYGADCALLIPGILIVLSSGKCAAERLIAFGLLIPVVYLGTITGAPLIWLTRLALMAFVGLLVRIAWYYPQLPGELGILVPAQPIAPKVGIS